MGKKKKKEVLYDIGAKMKTEGWKKMTRKRNIIMKLTPSEIEMITEKYGKSPEKLTTVQLIREWSAIKKAWDIS